MTLGARLLDDPRVHFVAGYRGREVVSGCFINRTGDVLGLSNFFSPDGEVGYWSDVVGFVRDALGPADLVGYERPATAARLHALGFEPVGNLTVWLKKRSP